jgi:hypothetical protein
LEIVKSEKYPESIFFMKDGDPQQCNEILSAMKSVFVNASASAVPILITIAIAHESAVTANPGRY